MDLIEREALYKEICRAYEYEYPTASGAFDEFVSKTLKNIIYNALAVDAVEVVRCKDCKHYNGTWCLVDDDIDIWKTVELDGFCSNGDRRGGD